MLYIRQIEVYARSFLSSVVRSVPEFLENIQQIAEHNNFFDPGFCPAEMDDIPELYRRIIDDPALLHDRLARLRGLFMTILNSIMFNQETNTNDRLMI